jgi:GNAT superfamily N-acetyltransferase
VEIRVEPATPERWDDVVTAFGARASRPDSCWCQRFRQHDEASNRTALEGEIRLDQTPVGLIAYVDGDPSAWSRVVPRRTLPGVQGNRALQPLFAEDAAAWWVTCFAVRRDRRGSGLGVTLLRAAIDFATEHGGTVLEGHPVDVERLKAAPSASALFTGTRSMFLAAGFDEIGRTYLGRPVMRRALG